MRVGKIGSGQVDALSRQRFTRCAAFPNGLEVAIAGMQAIFTQGEPDCPTRCLVGYGDKLGEFGSVPGGGMALPASDQLSNALLSC